ncbi:MAG: carbohydrate binding domain-containing protein [Gammaproteobacteria bacterium]|nr:carbohydrate binding domain-containing protein [Gammaproteobacteria bacterium]
MHAKAPKRIARKLTVLISAALLAACGQGDGPVSIPNEPATPLPPLPPGFCDPINFEIFCETPTIVNFNGGATTVIDNPDKSGLNDTDKVAQMQKFPDDPALLFGGTKFELSDAIDFTAGEAFSILVWSPRGVRVTFKLEEQGNPGGGREIEISHTGSSSWEELCYDFTGQTGGIPTPVTAVTIIFDNGVRGAADTDPDNWTFFYDEITQVGGCAGSVPPPELPVDFEGGVDSWFNDFGGGETRIETNPDASGINASATVATTRKFDGEVFAGTTLGLASAIDYSQGEAFTVKVWAARQVPLLFKLEGTNQELTLDHTGSSSWEELCFDFTGLTGGQPASDGGITFIFDLGEVGDAAGDPDNWTFYIDDVAQAADCGGGGPPVGGTPITPDNVVYATDPNLVVDLPPPVVDNFGSGAVFDFAFAGDPDYNPALQTTSGEGYGAGVHVGFVALTGYAAGFAAGFENVVFKVKGDPANLTSFEVKFIEGTDTSVLYDLTTYPGSEALGNGWYQVSIPMTDFAANIAVNAGFLLGPAGDQGAPFTFLLTDIGFTDAAGGGTGAVVNGGFETGDLTGWDVFENNGTITPDNTESSEGMWSAHMVAGPTNNPVIKQSFLFPGVVMPGQTVNISFDMKGSAADGGVIFPELISEGAGGAAVGNLLDTIAAPAADWATYSYTPTAGADVTLGVTFQLAVVCGGAATCSADVFVDNVVVELP